MASKKFKAQVHTKTLEINLKKLKTKYPEAVARAVQNTALKVASNARRIVPRDKGFLKGSIKAEPDVRSGFSRSSSGGVSNYASVWKVGTNAKYARYIEFGEPTGTGPNGGPRPYLRPAYDMEVTPQKMARRIKQQRKKLVHLKKGQKRRKLF